MGHVAPLFISAMIHAAHVMCLMRGHLSRAETRTPRGPQSFGQLSTTTLRLWWRPRGLLTSSAGKHDTQVESLRSPARLPAGPPARRVLRRRSRLRDVDGVVPVAPARAITVVCVRAAQVHGEAPHHHDLGDVAKDEAVLQLVGQRAAFGQVAGALLVLGLQLERAREVREPPGRGKGVARGARTTAS